MADVVQDEAANRALKALNRVEGQVRGIGRMVEEDRYCIDIVTQIEAARAALARVETDLLRRHLNHCVHRAMTSKDKAEEARVIEGLLKVFRK